MISKTTNHPQQCIVGVVVIFSLLLLTACGTDQPAAPLSTIAPGDPVEVNMFTLTSSSFEDNGIIADLYTYSMGSQCSGENFSPPLTWSGAPEGTASYLLTMVDPDGGNWVHWLLVNIPADTTSLEEIINGPETGIAGRNSFGSNGYGGPGPPSGTHRYVFTLYALDTTLDVAPGVTLREVTQLIKDHVLGQCQLTGLRPAN